MTNDFFDLIARLAKNEVDFVIVGGFAGVVHGCTYVTQDIDICCDFSVENLLKLQKAVCDLNPVHRMAANRNKLDLTSENCGSYKNLYLDTDIGQLDCLGSISGVGDYEQVKSKSILIDAEGINLRVLNIDALLESKKAMNRPRDKQAILQLKAAKKSKGK
ncbi:MAG: nucleotidyltransferase [Planctomycetes bacterium]|nr:nucleotidyltransferase [Planctomycetota bacterium]